MPNPGDGQSFKGSPALMARDRIVEHQISQENAHHFIRRTKTQAGKKARHAHERCPIQANYVWMVKVPRNAP
jgi:hypothetical protein